ncbi:helix-turn-helix domain-containing protein [Lachnospiraceae bacterium HCP1S3_C3]|nr:helix-turn-helix domain-containing protein [Lachnospiraceae bacterium]MDD6858474.1 helix-turn-helix domain-containing protein [Lachnospiraceae bacterium]
MEKRYFISDASKMVDVESHVLRYWEEELLIDIPRNEMGHRYYTDFHIKLLKNIKELKEQGFQLKAIKMLLPELMEGKEVTSDRLEKMKEEMLSHLDTVETQNVTSVVNSGINAVENGNNNTKLEQFEAIIGNIVSKALENNNDALGKNVSDRVSDSVIKEMDYLMRMRDEHEEERYKRLDETIRNYQTCRKEVAAASEEKGILKKFRRKKKA